MDKRAKKLKEKRRLDRQLAKMELVNELWNDMNNYVEETGRPKLKKTKESMLEVYNTAREVNAKISTKTGVIALVCSLIILYRDYDFDKENLLAFAGKLRKFILYLGNNDRSIDSLINEIEKDYEVSILERCKNLPRIPSSEYSKYNLEELMIDSTVEHFSHFIAVNAHTFMNYLSFTIEDKNWNSEDLELFINNSFILYKNILNDALYLKTLNDILINERDICVNLTTGSVNEIIKQ